MVALRAADAGAQVILSGLMNAGYTRQQALEMMQLTEQLRSGGRMGAVYGRFMQFSVQQRRDIERIAENWNSISPQKLMFSQFDANEARGLLSSVAGPAGPRVVIREVVLPSLMQSDLPVAVVRINPRLYDVIIDGRRQRVSVPNNVALPRTAQQQSEFNSMVVESAYAGRTVRDSVPRRMR